MWTLSRALCVSLPSSPEAAVESLADYYSAGEPSAPLKLSRTQRKSSLPDKTTGALNHSQYGTTYGLLMESRGGELLTLFREGFPVRTSAWLEKERESTGKGQDCGKKWHESLATFDRDSCSWKTRQLSLLGGGAESLPTWPRWATWGGMGVLVHFPSVHVLTESACGLSLLRPTAQCWKAWTFKNISSLIRRNHADGNIQEQSARCFHKMITPLSNEILMLWPEGWTDLKPLETDKFQQWLSSHGKRSDLIPERF